MSKKKTLHQRLAELTSTVPSTTFNPDAPDYDDGTGAGLSKYEHLPGGGDEEGDDRFSGDGYSTANLRVAADMESIGQEYHGKRVSRKELGTVPGFGSIGDASNSQDSRSGSDSSGSEEEETDGDNSNNKDSDRRRQEASTPISFSLNDVSSSDDDEEGDEGDALDDDPLDDHGGDGAGRGSVEERSRSDDEAEAADERQSQDHHQSNVFAGLRGDGVGARAVQLDNQHERGTKGGGRPQGELKRAREALRQRQWWDSLLEVRILLQRLVNAANQLPGPIELPLYLEGDESLTALAEEAVGAAQDLGAQLSAVRRSHMACWDVNKNDSGRSSLANPVKPANATTAATPGNAAEASPTGGDFVAGEDEREVTADREHGVCMEWSRGVIARWHERTRSVDPSLQKKFRVVNQGPWAQITASLADRSRAQRRSFMTEAETSDFLGRKLAKRRKAAQEDGSETSARSAEREKKEGNVETGAETEILGRERREVVEPLDMEVVDDRDFYQHLLKEFMDASGADGIERGSSAGVPVRRKSRKKSVDRRASKGRKIKYLTHPKMQNFMFPRVSSRRMNPEAQSAKKRNFLPTHSCGPGRRWCQAKSDSPVYLGCSRIKRSAPNSKKPGRGEKKLGWQCAAPWPAVLLFVRCGWHAKNYGRSCRSHRTGTWRCTLANSEISPKLGT